MCTGCIPPRVYLRVCTECIPPGYTSGCVRGENSAQRGLPEGKRRELCAKRPPSLGEKERTLRREGLSPKVIPVSLLVDSLASLRLFPFHCWLIVVSLVRGYSLWRVSLSFHTRFTVGSSPLSLPPVSLLGFLLRPCVGLALFHCWSVLLLITRFTVGRPIPAHHPFHCWSLPRSLAA